MGLREAFDTVRPGERIMYRQNNILANIKPYPQGDGGFAARTWITCGAERISSAAYEPVDEGWIARLEQLLRDLGVDPEAYHLVFVPDNSEPWSGWA
jgi:hypothetical protein